MYSKIKINVGFFKSFFYGLKPLFRRWRRFFLQAFGLRTRDIGMTRLCSTTLPSNSIYFYYKLPNGELKWKPSYPSCRERTVAKPGCDETLKPATAKQLFEAFFFSKSENLFSARKPDSILINWTTMLQFYGRKKNFPSWKTSFQKNREAMTKAYFWSTRGFENIPASLSFRTRDYLDVNGNCFLLWSKGRDKL